MTKRPIMLAVPVLALVAVVTAQASPRQAHLDSMGDLADNIGKMDSGLNLSDYAGLGANAARAGYSGRRMMEAYEKLSDADADAEPELDPEGMPRMPSHCAPSSTDDGGDLTMDAGEVRDREGCECFKKAYERLRFVRRQFEKLRRVYVSTRNYVDWAKAFGDDVSAIHGAAGLAWQAQKLSIMKSMDELRQSYDEQYERGMESLKTALDMIARCEAEHFDEPDWFNRFGFIYYQFMAERYRRSD